VNTYLDTVAEALTAAGLVVADTWTEPLTPPNHVIEVDAGDNASLHLVWCESDRWTFIWYSGPYNPGDGWRPELGKAAALGVVVDEVRRTIERRTSNDLHPDQASIYTALAEHCGVDIEAGR
jgi:hypothetical protein